MTVQDQTSATHGVLLTDVAATKVKSLLEQEGRDDLRLRVGVQPGGCSGLIYQLYFDERTLDGDQIADFGGVEVVVDRMSAPYLGGATIAALVTGESIDRLGIEVGLAVWAMIKSVAIGPEAVTDAEAPEPRPWPPR